MTHVIAQLEAEFSEQIGLPQKDWDYDTKKLFQEKISDMAAHNYFGFDINPDLVKATKMNMVMNNDGSGNILQTNSLLPPHEWTDEFRTKLAEALGIKKEEIRNHKTLEFFDVIVTNPHSVAKYPLRIRISLSSLSLLISGSATRKLTFGLCLTVCSHLFLLRYFLLSAAHSCLLPVVVWASFCLTLFLVLPDLVISENGLSIIIV